MARRAPNISAGQLIMMLTIALAAIFLFVSLTTKTAEGIEFSYPEDASFLVTTFTILIIGGAVVLGYNLTSKIGKPMSKIDAFSLVLVIAACWLVWQFVIAPIFPNLSLEGATFSLIKKVGMVP